MNIVVVAATVPAILALVNFAKGLGLSSKLAMLLAVILGGGLSYADYAFGTTGVYNAIVQGILLGLGAAGLYDISEGRDA